MTTITAPALPGVKELERSARKSTRTAFRALFLRDLTVLRKTLKEFLPRTLLQPFLLVFIFTYVFPKIGQGVGGSGAAAAEFSTRLVAGVVGLSIMFQGIQSVALPMVQEFGYTREIEDRVLAPMPVALVAIEKVISGAFNGLFAALLVFPIAAIVPATPVHLDINWPVLLTLAPLACYMCGALGLTFGTRFDPRTVPMLFGIVVLPLTFLGAIYYSWSSLEPVKWLQVFVLVNPLVYMCEGFRAALDDERAHEPLGGLPGDDRLLGPLHLARDRRVQEAGPVLSASARTGPCRDAWVFSRRECGYPAGPMSGGMNVTFHGVRGSTPCDGPQLARYGGNTSCVAIEVEGQAPIVFDLGTGLRNFGIDLLERDRAAEFHGTVLLSHLHWDHVQGLPFFVPLHRSGAMLDVYGPRQEEGPLGEVFTGMMQPPYFPITPDQLEGTVEFHDVGDDDFPLSTTAKVRSRWIRHVGPTLGYRLEWQGVSIAYLSDHGQGCVGTMSKAGLSEDRSDDFVPDDVLDLCDGVDLLIHDAQHTPAEFEHKRHWGHCTVDYAVHVAKEAGAARLALFHHDPAHSDDQIDLLVQAASDVAADIGAGEVLAASEGLALELTPHHSQVLGDQA